MKLIIAVGIGGAIGSILRYLLNKVIVSTNYSGIHFPVSTLIVNIVGSFIIGWLFAYTIKVNTQEVWKLFLMTGVCGGFTTFSALSLESLLMIRDGRTMHFLLYITCSIAGGIFATFLGYKLVAT